MGPYAHPTQEWRELTATERILRLTLANLFSLLLSTEQPCPEKQYFNDSQKTGYGNLLLKPPAIGSMIDRDPAAMLGFLHHLSCPRYIFHRMRSALGRAQQGKQGRPIPARSKRWASSSVWGGPQGHSSAWTNHPLKYTQPATLPIFLRLLQSGQVCIRLWWPCTSFRSLLFPPTVLSPRKSPITLVASQCLPGRALQLTQVILGINSPRTQTERRGCRTSLVFTQQAEMTLAWREGGHR